MIKYLLYILLIPFVIIKYTFYNRFFNFSKQSTPHSFSHIKRALIKPLLYVVFLKHYARPEQ